MDSTDPRTLRLYDLATHEAVIVTCQCGEEVIDHGERRISLRMSV